MSESEALELAAKYYKENAVTKENLKAFPEALRVMVERLEEMNNKNTISKENK